MGTLLRNPPYFDNQMWINTLWVQSSHQFCICLVGVSPKLYLSRMPCKTMSKALLNSRHITSEPTPPPYSQGQLLCQRKKLRLVWQDLFLTNSHWLLFIALLSSRCLETVSWFVWRSFSMWKPWNHSLPVLPGSGSTTDVVFAFSGPPMHPCWTGPCKSLWWQGLGGDEWGKALHDPALVWSWAQKPPLCWIME